MKRTFKHAFFKASIDPTYAWCILRDFAWAITIWPLQWPYQPGIDWFSPINTPICALALWVAGLVGIYNFFHRNYWVTTWHNFFNLCFTGYIVVGFIHHPDGAIGRNAVDFLIICWLVFRIRNDHLVLTSNR